MVELRFAHPRGDAVRAETGRRRHCGGICFRVAANWGFCEREGASVATASGNKLVVAFIPGNLAFDMVS